MQQNSIHAAIGQKPPRQQVKNISKDNILKLQKKYTLSAPDIAWLSKEELYRKTYRSPEEFLIYIYKFAN